jgi:Arm DNA-binding domain
VIETEIESANLLRQADPTELVEWTHTNRTLRYVASAAVSPEDLLLPSFWVRVGNAGHLNQNDIVRCIPADSSWFVELLVRDIGPEGVVMMVLRAGQFEGAVAPPGATKHAADEGASFYYAGPLLKWQVVGKNNRVWKSGFKTQEEAAVWLAEHRKMQSRTTKGPT